MDTFEEVDEVQLQVRRDRYQNALAAFCQGDAKGLVIHPKDDGRTPKQHMASIRSSLRHFNAANGTNLAVGHNPEGEILVYHRQS